MPSVFSRRHAVCPFKELCKVVRVVEAHGHRDVRDGPLCVPQFPLRLRKPLPVCELDDAQARGLPEDVAQIILVQIECRAQVVERNPAGVVLIDVVHDVRNAAACL